MRGWRCWEVSEQGSRRKYGCAATERKAAPPVAEAAAWSSNEAQSSDSFGWLNDNAELRRSNLASLPEVSDASVASGDKKRAERINRNKRACSRRLRLRIGGSRWRLTEGVVLPLAQRLTYSCTCRGDLRSPARRTHHPASYNRTPPERCRRGRSLSDSHRIRRVSRRGGAFFALRKTFLTDLDARERSDQSKSAKNSKKWLKEPLF